MTRQLFDPSFRLQQLELYNWGGFAGYHSAQIDEKGTAIVGPTGSGKTTVVDALMTLLGTNPKYNLASTGGHESDRDLVSYVRGVAGAGDGSGGQSHIARPGKTLTGICATLGNTDQQVRLGALLWVDSSSSAASDVHKTWIFATGAGQSLQHWLTQHGEGGLRQLRQWAKDTEGVWLFHNNKRNYLARVRDFFEVRDNAFNLLNRAAGLKQLNSIDEIFRELVLDDCAQFERAREVADSFDDLTAIYQEIELARRQIRALEPVKIHHKSHLELDQKLREQELLVRLFPGWYAARSQQRWQQEWQRLNEAAAQAAQQLDEAERQCQQQDEQVQHLHGQFLQLGGSDIQTLQELIQRTEKERNQCERNAADYQRLTRVLELGDGLEQGRLLANQQQLKSLKLQWQQEAELEDVPAYLERLQELVEEDLPARQKRFREYLNRSSEDGVVQLLSEINDEVERIRDRLEDVNATLRRVDFQQGRYLQIVARDVQHESRRTLTTAMEQLGHARYVEDDGEAHYRALQNIVMLLRDAVERQRTQAAKALLDPRFRLEFKVADICRHTDEIIETRSGSQGGSGGEKEIIASYVLTASLSYALCPDGSPLPLFATIVLDEAFSRSSHAVAGRIIDALNEFGLHPVFVTPNKEMRLLRNHTRSAIVVHRRGNESSMTSMSWRELGELAQTRQQKRTRHEAS